MSRFSGRIILEGDIDEARSFVGDSVKLANTLNAWKKTQRITSVIKTFQLRDGAYCTVVDLEHMRVVQVVAPVTGGRLYVGEEPTSETSDTTGVIDVVSGVVTSPTIVKQVVTIPNDQGEFEQVEVDVLNGFTSAQYSASRYSDVDRRRRLAVVEAPMFQQLFTNPALIDVIWSEHAHAKPAQYSGAMRKVVQFLLGVGKILRPTWEERWMDANQRNYIDAEQVSLETELPVEVKSGFGLYYQDPPVTTLYYDYRFAKTHGISFDQDDKPWVIEISGQGVHAMPLYLDPVSLTEGGRQRYIDVSPELEEFIDEIGGIPLGVRFPASFDLAEWKRSGEVVELISAAGMSEFYGKSMFSSDIGWSFNSRGSQAHNCAVGIEDNLSTGNHYRISIDLTRDVMPELSGNRAILSSYFKDLYKINKCRRMDEATATSILAAIQQDRESGLEQFNDLTVAPTLQGSASMSLVRKGILYNPAKPKGQPQIKFPEPLLNGLVSFDFGPYVLGAGTDRCDAPMFVCHIQDNVEVVNYFMDLRSRPGKESEYTRAQCQYTGIWTVRTYGGGTYVAGNFYSSRWDWRLELTPDTSVATYTGRRLDTQGRAQTEYFFSSCIRVSATTRFAVKYTTKTTYGQTHGVAAAVPFHIRDCYYMVQTDATASEGRTDGMYIESTPAANTQLWKINNFVFHWRDAGLCSGNIDAGPMSCVAKKYGEWDIPSCVADKIPMEIQYSVCPAGGYAWDLQQLTVYAPLWDNAVIGSATFGGRPLPSTWSVVYPATWTGKCEVRLITDSSIGEIIAKKEEVVGDETTLSSWWFRFSPDPDDNSVPWMGASQSCLGEDIVNYHDDMDGYQTKHAGGPSNMHASVYACYTGVIR